MKTWFQFQILQLHIIFSSGLTLLKQGASSLVFVFHLTLRSYMTTTCMLKVYYLVTLLSLEQS